MGLLRSRGVLWQHQRKLLDPGFNHRYLARATAICYEAAGDLVRGWRRCAAAKDGSITIDAREDCEEFSMEVVTRFACGGGRDDKPRAARILAAFRTILRQFFVWMFVDMYVPHFSRWPLPSNRRVWRELAVVDAYVDELITNSENAMQKKAKKDGGDSGAINDDDASPPNILDMLCAAQNDRKQIRDEVMTLLFAGHDTTARRNSAEDFSRLNALLCTAMDQILIPAYCFALS